MEETPNDNEDITPFKVVGDNLIKHFSYEEHNLRLDKYNINRDESSRCEACVLPIYSDPIYNCENCRFILHEKCANLPKKKRLVFHTKPFTLWTKPRPRVLGSEDLTYRDYFVCSACGIKSIGFRYILIGVFLMYVVDLVPNRSYKMVTYILYITKRIVMLVI